MNTEIILIAIAAAGAGYLMGKQKEDVAVGAARKYVRVKAHKRSDPYNYRHIPAYRRRFAVSGMTCNADYAL